MTLVILDLVSTSNFLEPLVTISAQIIVIFACCRSMSYNCFCCSCCCWGDKVQKRTVLGQLKQWIMYRIIQENHREDGLTSEVP